MRARVKAQSTWQKCTWKSAEGPHSELGLMFISERTSLLETDKIDFCFKVVSILLGHSNPLFTVGRKEGDSWRGVFMGKTKQKKEKL